MIKFANMIKFASMMICKHCKKIINGANLNSYVDEHQDWNYPISEAIFSIAFLSPQCGKLLNYLHTYKSPSAYKGGVQKN